MSNASICTVQIGTPRGYKEPSSERSSNLVPLTEGTGMLLPTLSLRWAEQERKSCYCKACLPSHPSSQQKQPGSCCRSSPFLSCGCSCSNINSNDSNQQQQQQIPLTPANNVSWQMLAATAPFLLLLVPLLLHSLLQSRTGRNDFKIMISPIIVSMDDWGGRLKSGASK
jgi:hypothetical protein